ncbi:MAG TPA: diguanylate cyclase [Thermoanaerobaculia bacterium]
MMTAEHTALLLATFLEEAAQRLASMREDTLLLETSPGSREAVENLLRGFHSFAGVSGVPGAELLVMVASRGEHACRRLASSGDAPAAADLVRLRNLLDVVTDEVGGIATRGAVVVPSRPEPRSAREHDLLLIEDNPLQRTWLATELRQHGFAVRTASNLAEARSEVLARLPEAIVADICLPDGSGLELIAAIRKSPDGASVVAVAASALDDFIDKVDAIRAGIDFYVEKPVDAATLAARLRSSIKARRATGSRILCVEDDVHQTLFLRTLLEGEGYEVTSCRNGEEFQVALEECTPDLVLMDILLPGVSGYELARFARQQDDFRATPIIFLTTEGAIDARLDATLAGGDDHLVKPIDPAVLLPVVRARLSRAKLLRQSLDCDSLTGLLNRAAFSRRLSAASAARRKSDTASALVLIDVDHFKAVNDGYGHAAGDAVLISLASLLRERVRPSDAVCRFGGEELALLIHDVTEADAIRLADRLRSEFAALGHGAILDESRRVTFSAGVASVDDASTLDAWIARADRALYEAKRRGRNRAVGASTPMLRTVAPPVALSSQARGG